MRAYCYPTKRERPFFRIFLISIVVLLIIVAIGIGVYFGIKSIDDNKNGFLGYYESNSKLGIYSKAAVSTDSAPCAEIGRKILELDGTAVDAIIAVLLCMGVTIPESMGLGGGSVITLYSSTQKQAYVIDARETAPLGAYKDMYEKNSTYSTYGPLAIAVPGELSGYWMMHHEMGFGKLEWSQLFKGAIELAEDGFSVSEHFASALKQNERYFQKHKALKERFTNPDTGKLYSEGEKFRNPELAETLNNLAKSEDPVKYFYNDEIAKKIIEDINNQIDEYDGISPVINITDFSNYKPRNRSVVTANLRHENLRVHSFPLPGSGNLLSFILQVMDKYDDLYPDAKKTLKGTVKFYHRLMETFKFAYSLRMHLGDDEYDDVFDVISNLTNSEFITYIKNRIDDSKTYNDPAHYDAEYFMSDDHGTAHVSVVDKYGNAAAVSTTVNLYFGSKVYSPSTGIILNDEMDDFSIPNVNNSFDVPPSDYNQIYPHKRPLSSMCPTIITDQQSGKIRLVIGASGGTKITTANAIVAMRHLWFGDNIKQAIDAERIHHQLFPNEIVYEKNFPTDVLRGLQSLGHVTRSLGDERAAIVMAIAQNKEDVLSANSDYRKGGDVDGL